jgi:hydrogenase expression/formation protein HypE
MILEEGLEIETLRRVAESMQTAAERAGVQVVTGDTKVVPRGAADKLFINTAGLGVISQGVNISASRAQPGDVIIVNGFLGDHGAAILDARGELALENTIQSDCQPLHGLVQQMRAACPDIHCLRDATRGGLASVLNEFAQSSACCLRLREGDLPVREEVRGFCEILGLDPLYLANEGKLAAIVPNRYAEAVLTAMQTHPAGRDAAIIGEVSAAPKSAVIMDTLFGGERVVDLLVGEPLPRIC